MMSADAHWGRQLRGAGGDVTHTSLSTVSKQAVINTNSNN